MKTILFLFVVLPLAASTQNNSIDSLTRVLQTEKEDTNKVNTLFEFAREFRYTKADTAVYFINQAFALAKKLDYKMGIADSKRMIGTLYAKQGKCDEGVKACNDALALYNKLLLSTSEREKEEILRKIGFTYNEIGNNRFSQGNYPEALKYSLLALKILEQLGDKQGISAMEFNIGNIYYCQHNYNEALQYDSASLKIMEQLGNKANISNCYNAIGIAYFDQGNYPEALKNYTVSLKLAEESRDKYVIAEIYTDLGVINDKQENFSKALKYDFAALKIYKEIEFNWQIPFVYNNIASVYIKQKKYNDASEYLNNALSISKATGHLEYIKLTYENLATLDSAQGNYKKALQDYKLDIACRDSLLNKESTKKLVQSQMQYDFDKKDDAAKAAQDKKDAVSKAEIENQKTVRNFSYAGTLVVFGFAGISFYRFRRRKKLQSRQEMLNERLRISRELHDDIGSTLGSISIYSEVAKSRNEKNENAEEALSKIGITSRELIDKMSDIVWSLNPGNESFEQLQDRMTAFSAMMLTPRNIICRFVADDETKKIQLSGEQRKNIFLIFKEAIYNIVKYAESKKVNIHLNMENNIFKMLIQDDGKGFDMQTISAYNGNGMKNMQARAEDIHAVLNIDSAINEGTIIELILKL